MEAVGFSEIEPFPSAVLEHHYPHVMNYGDMTHIVSYLKAGFMEAPDLVVGGTPCQAFSVAGLQNSLDDDRGQLSLEYARILNECDRQNGNRTIAIWENVPGVLSTKDNAFGCFLGALAGDDEPLEPSERPEEGKSNTSWKWDKKKKQHLPKWGKSGYVIGPRRRVAWRVLDAQYFGVAQRRKRVFVVASAREGFDPRAVLLEREGVQRHTRPSRKTGQGATGDASEGPGECGSYCFEPGILKREGGESRVIREKCSTLRADMGDNQPAVAYSIIADATPKIGEDISGTLRADGGGGRVPPSVVYNERVVGALDTECGLNKLAHQSMRAGHWVVQVLKRIVRRLTPVECERLQGFPDGYTNVPFGRPKHEDQLCPDGHRYRALGNSMAVPVMRWIGEKLIKEVGSAE
jgi:DNA (cytosine-5)-methyltransferase 1